MCIFKICLFYFSSLIIDFLIKFFLRCFAIVQIITLLASFRIFLVLFGYFYGAYNFFSNFNLMLVYFLSSLGFVVVFENFSLYLACLLICFTLFLLFIIFLLGSFLIAIRGIFYEIIIIIISCFGIIIIIIVGYGIIIIIISIIIIIFIIIISFRIIIMIMFAYEIPLNFFKFIPTIWTLLIIIFKINVDFLKLKLQFIKFSNLIFLLSKLSIFIYFQITI